MNDYHNCIFVGADRLALASDEPAQVIVSTTYADCHPQRQLSWSFTNVTEMRRSMIRRWIEWKPVSPER
jgi:hypothetical protein